MSQDPHFGQNLPEGGLASRGGESQFMCLEAFEALLFAKILDESAAKGSRLNFHIISGRVWPLTKSAVSRQDEPGCS